MIFTSSISLNWDPYDPEILSFYFLDSISPHSLCLNNNNNNNNNNEFILIYILECSFLCADLLTCILLHSFYCNLILVFRSSLHCKTCVLVFLCSFSCSHPILVFLLHQLLSLTSIFCHRENKKIIKQDYKIPVLTENMTGVKLLFPSFISSIPFSSSCSLTSSFSSIPSIISFFCFPFFLLPGTSVSFPSDFSYDNSSSLEF